MVHKTKADGRSTGAENQSTAIAWNDVADALGERGGR